MSAGSAPGAVALDASGALFRDGFAVRGLTGIRAHPRQRHELFGLAARIAEHEPLVAGRDLRALFGYAEIDVRRLRMQGLQDRRRVDVETISGDL